MCGGPLGVISICHGFLCDADSTVYSVDFNGRKMGDFRTDVRSGRPPELIRLTVTSEMPRLENSETTETVRTKLSSIK